MTSGPRLGDIEAAVVASLTTPQFAVVSGGVLCVLGVGVVARRFPELVRHVISGGSAGRLSSPPAASEPIRFRAAPVSNGHG